MSRANFVQVQLAAAATDIQTTLSVKAPVGGFQLPPADGGRLVLTDSPGRPLAFEVISYTGVTGTGPYTLTGVTRGLEGTVGLAWGIDAYVFQSLTTGELDAIVASREPAFAAGTTAQYRRGDKTWQDLAAAVRAAVLTGLSTATATAATAADTLLVAVGKLQAQISSLSSGKLDSGATAVAATKLASARTINGVAFNGTANITVADATKEPASANLTALSSLVGAANKSAYFTAAGAMSVYDLTVFGRQVAACTDAGALCTLLTLGSAATRAATTSAADTTSERLWRTNDLVKQTSSVDTTAGRVMLTGAGGLLGPAPLLPSNDYNNGADYSGIIRNNNSIDALNYPPQLPGARQSLAALNVRYSTGYGWQLGVQTPGATPSDANTRAFLRTEINNAWSNWLELWHSGNFNPATKEDRPFTIAVIGDSLSAHYPLTGEPWPAMLETYLNNSGSRKFRVLNFSVGSNTCYRANTEALYGTMTASQAVVAAKPDTVIVALGGGDVLTGFGGRTLAQVKADATTLFTALRSGLPSAVICHVPIIFHDNTHGTPSTLINRQVVPFFWSKPSTGIFAGCISMERGGDAVSSAQRTRYVDLAGFYSHVAGLTQVNKILSMDLFRIARVGGLGPDGLHVNELGKKMQLGYMIKSLTSAVHSVFGGLAPKGFVSWEDPDTLFTSVLQSSGAGGQWVARTDVPDPVEHLTRQDDSFGLLDVELWALGYRMGVSISRTSVKTTERAFISFFGGRRGSPMYISINDGAFLPDAAATLDSKGSTLAELLPLLGAINYTIRYKVGGEIYGPVTFTGTT